MTRCRTNFIRFETVSKVNHPLKLTDRCDVTRCRTEFNLAVDQGRIILPVVLPQDKVFPAKNLPAKNWARHRTY